MTILSDKDAALFRRYKALGSIEELEKRLANPYPQDDSYAPLPYSEVSTSTPLQGEISSTSLEDIDQESFNLLRSSLRD